MSTPTKKLRLSTSREPNSPQLDSIGSLRESSMAESQQEKPRSNKSWTKKPVNDSDKGKVYERLIVTATLLTLKDGQEMICDMEEAGKFDDLIVSVENDGYYLGQIKHKQNNKFTITERNLLLSEGKCTFNLNSYILSFEDKIRKNQPFAQNISLIKELLLITNVDFDSSPKEYVEEVSNSVQERASLDPKKQSKRYRFKQSKYFKIKSKLGLQNIDDVFLEKLVLEVNFPSIEDLQVFIKENVRSLIPIRLDEVQAKEASQMFQRKVKAFFDELPTENYKIDIWANVNLRQKLLFEILLQLKETVKIGTTINYVGSTLEPILENILVDYPADIKQKLENFLHKSSFEILNIIVPPERSLPTLASCKIWSYLRQQNHIDCNKLWMMDVKSEKDGVELAKIFMHSNVEVFKDCVFVVDFSHEACMNGINSRRVAEKILDSLKDIKKMMLKFIFITSQTMNSTTNIGSFLEISGYLTVENVTDEEARAHLSQKSLLVKNGPSVSFEELGIDFASLDSLSLSELVLADENSQIDLCLPLYDKFVEETYMERNLRLPAIDITNIEDGLKNQLCLDRGCYDVTFERDQDRPINLLRNLKKLEISHENSENLFVLMWSTNITMFNELRKALEESLKSSKVEVTEDILLTDSAVFESSRYVKTAVVVGLPGMGKSTLLTHLCNTVSKKLNSSVQKLIVRVNLGSCRPETWGTPVKDETDVINFFITHSQSNVDKGDTDAIHIMTHLSKGILKEIFKGKSPWRVIILLDGFDEISRTGRQFVLELISLLMAMLGVDRIIVTSRSDVDVHKELETLFNQFALHLCGLDSHKQVSLLGSYWCNSIINENRFALIDKIKLLEQCKGFASKAVSIVNYSIKDDDRTILDIPLQCILFAECFQKDLKNYIQGNSFSPEAIYNFDLLSLLAKFIDSKFDIWFSEKEMNNVRNDRSKDTYEKRKKSFIRKAMRVSVYYMTRDKEKAEYLLGKKWNANKFKNDIERVKELGLVARFDEDASLEDRMITSFELIHRTFAEYLVAKYLTDAFNDSELALGNEDPTNCRATYEIVLEMCLVNDGYAGVRRFFTQMVSSLLPDLKMGCPFQVQNRKNVVSKWPMVSHDKFNDFLASHIITSEENKLHLYHRLFGGDGDSNYALYVPLITWLYLCLKEHIVRNLTEDPSDSFLEVLADDLYKVITHLTEKNILFGHTDSKSTYEQVFTYLLFWTLPSSETDEETKIEIRDKVFSILRENVDSPLLKGDDNLLRATSSLAAVKFAIGRQLGFKLKLVCNKDDEHCLMSSIFSSFPWSNIRLERESELVNALNLEVARHSPWSDILLERKSELANNALNLEVTNQGKYSLNRFSNYQTACFKEILEMGSPDYWDGNTCDYCRFVGSYLCALRSQRLNIAKKTI